MVKIYKESAEYSVTTTTKKNIHFITLKGYCDTHCSDVMGDVIDIIEASYQPDEKVVFIANDITFCCKAVLGQIYRAKLLFGGSENVSAIAPEKNILREKLFIMGLANQVSIYDTLEEFHAFN